LQKVILGGISLLTDRRTVGEPLPPIRPFFSLRTIHLAGIMPVAPPSVGDEKHPVQDSPCVLLVDDDPTTLSLLSAMLQQEGFTALCAGSVNEARALAVSRGFDLAILDLNLPDGNGLELCRWLAGQSASADVPVLMLSSEQDVRTKVAGFESGAVDYVTKPFHRAEVMARVRTHLRLRAAHRSIVELQALKLSQVASAQQALMPQPEKLPDAKFHIHYQPLQEAGGDFCHVARVGEALHDYVVGDVCGHHVGTAMTTAAIQALLHQNGTSLYSPGEILKTINRVAQTLVSDGRFITLVYARLNRQTRRLQVASAGHPPAVLQRIDGSSSALWLEGDVIGAFEGADFGRVETVVHPGERIFLFSDALVEGWPDGRSATDWKAGVERLERVLPPIGIGPPEAVAFFMERVLKAGAPSDDITLMAIEV
jgi:sigma-B regulation protein RsbU (phosphoserine phosphatase)